MNFHHSINNRLAYLIAILFLLFGKGPLFSQIPPNSKQQINNPWKATIPPYLQLQQKSTTIPESKATYYTLDEEQFYRTLSNIAKKETSGNIVLPHPDLTFRNYTISETTTLSSKLAQKFPSIKSYQGISNDNRKVWISTDSKGIHITMESDKGSFYIDKLNEFPNTYISYLKKDAVSKGLHWKDDILENPAYTPLNQRDTPQQRTRNATTKNESIRVFRLAVATTGEYTQYHGGTVEDGLGAVNTAIVRVNAIFEREIGVRFELVDNNDKIIFTNPDEDPFTNADTYALIEENVEVLNDSIGTENFDIGHVFFGNSFSGLAYLNSVCSPNKAGACSGHPQPNADPFFVDVLCHEIGHQFGAYHSHNAECNRTASSAYEPGSGSTIMAYTGICPPNLQNNSDDYFHAGSLEEMLNFLNNISCGTTLPSNNLAPNITEMPLENLTIPSNTFFELSGKAQDPNGDELYYTWDQIDLGPQTTPTSPIGNAPLFRSFPFTERPVRYFPQLSTQHGGPSIFGELLPSYSRDLNFRFIVRDLKGGIAFQDVRLAVDGEKGPFLLNEETLKDLYYFDEEIDIRWDVAGTTNAPIDCQTVDILLSLDDGQTYTELLLDDTENDGYALVSLPAKNAEQARIKIKASNNVFYTLSNQSFSIEEPIFSLKVLSDTLKICNSENNSSTIEVSTKDYSTNGQKISLEVDQLPEGIQLTENSLEVAPGENIRLSFSIDPNIGDTIFTATLKGSTNEFQFTDQFTVSYSKAIPEKPTLQSPIDNAEFIDLQPSFSWIGPLNSSTKYRFELANDSLFTNKILERNHLTSNNLASPLKLESNTTYFWRVSSENNCGSSDYSPIFSFNTAIITCDEFSSADTPITIGTTADFEISSSLEVFKLGKVEDISVKSIKGKHTFINDLVFELVGPDGTRITLLDQVCSSEDDFDLGFDDKTGNETIDCPPNNGTIYKPLNALNIFNNKVSEGVWQLLITDKASEDGGQLDSWELELCIQAPEFNVSLNQLDFNQAELEWDYTHSNLKEFVIERKTKNSNTFELVNTASSGNNTLIDSDLEENTTYEYRIMAVTEENYFTFSPIVEFTTGFAPPNKPTALVGREIEIDRLTLTWIDNATNETSYQVFRSDENQNNFLEIALLSANQSTFLDEGLLENTFYYYSVAAIRNNKKSFSDTILVKTLELPPAAPENLVAEQVTDNGALITWLDRADNEIGYQIFRSDANQKELTLLTELPINSTKFTDTNLIENSTYLYLVAAEGNRENTFSDTLEIKTQLTPPNQPTNLTASNIDSDKLTLNWNDNADNETGYQVFRSLGTSNNFEEIASLSANSNNFLDERLEDNTQYHYIIAAVRNNKKTFSDTLQVKTLELPPAAPENLRIKTLSSSSTIITWLDQSDNETGYQIFKSNANQKELNILANLPINTTEYEDVNLLDNTTYLYLVSAKGNRANSFSDTLEVKTQLLPPNEPSDLRASNITTNSIVLNWEDNATNETAYRLLRKRLIDSSFNTVIDLSINATTYNDTNLESNTVYQYLIEAIRENVSSFSDTLNVATLIEAPSAPTALQANQIDVKKIELNWQDNADNEEMYLVIRETANNAVTDTLAQLVANSENYIDTLNLSFQTTYNYFVSASNKGGYSNPITVTITTFEEPPNAPNNIELINKNETQVQIAWQDNSINETGFEVFLSENDSSNYTIVETLSANSTTTSITGLTPNTPYFLKVRAINNGGSSNFTQTLVVETDAAELVAPSNLRFTSIPVKEVQLLWDNNNIQEVEIIVERSISSNKDFKQIALTKIGATAYTDLNFSPGSQYYYRVAAYDGTQSSGYSNEVFVPSEITSIDQPNKNAALLIYPNPTDEHVYIENENNELTIDHIKIYDISGRVFFEKSYSKINQKSIRIDLTEAVKGLYIIQINNKIQRKLIKN